MKDRFAKLIRIVTVPPVLVGALIAILAGCRPGIFRNAGEAWFALFCLDVIPVLAYPLQSVIPGFRGKGREGQRKLAFLLSIAGYALAVSAGLATGASKELQFIYDSYLASVVMLTIVNKLLGIRASGHACSVTGPLLFLTYFFGAPAILPVALIAWGVAWSSLRLKRHTLPELAWGAAISAASFALMGFWYLR